MADCSLLVGERSTFAVTVIQKYMQIAYLFTEQVQ